MATTTKTTPIKRSNFIPKTERKYAHVTIAISYENGTIKELVDKIADLIEGHNKYARGVYSFNGPRELTYVIEGNLLTQEAFETTFETS